MQGDHIALLQHLLERAGDGGVAQRELVDRVVEEHPHAHGLSEDGHLRTDVPVADDAECLAPDFVRAAGALEPLARVGRVAAGGELAMQRDDLGDGQFRDRPGIAEGRVEHRNARLGRGIKVHLVGPGAEAPDGQQAFALGEHLSGELGLRSDPDDMGTLDLVDQCLAFQCARVRADAEALALKQVGARLMGAFEEDDLDL